MPTERINDCKLAFIWLPARPHIALGSAKYHLIAGIYVYDFTTAL